MQLFSIPSILSVGLTSVLLYSSAGSALDFSYELSLDSEHTDNANRTNDNEVDETETSLQADFRFASGASTTFQYDGLYSTEYVTYSEGVFEDELFVTGRSTFVFDLIDEFLGWDFEHSQDYRRTDNALVNTPDNIERRSVIETGPFVNWRLTRRDTLRFEADYLTSDFENTQTADSDRINTSLDWQHAYSQISSVVVGVDYNKADFDTNANNFDLWRVSISHNRVLKDGNFSFGVGFNEIDREVGEKVDGLFVTSTLSKISGRREIGLTLTQQVTDSSLGLDLDGGGDGPEDDAGNFAIQDIIERRSMVLSYRYNFSVDSLLVALSWDDEDYDLQPEDQRRYALQVNYNWNLSSRSSIDLNADFSREDFLEQDDVGVNDRYRFGVNYNYSVSRFVTLQLGASYDERKNDDIEAREYTDNRINIGVSYTPE